MIYTIDIGGSSIKHSLVDLELANSPKLLGVKTTPLKTRKFIDLKNAILEIISEAINDYPIKKISICTTGSVNKEGIVLNAGHFEGYSNISWESLIKEKFLSIEEVSTLNDGKASALAEYKSLEEVTTSFIHIVVGTGVGGSAIVNGKFIEGSGGFAGNFGHLKVTNERTIKCSCGKSGCVETLCSVPGIVSDFAINNLNWRNERLEAKQFRDIVELAKKGSDEANIAFHKAGVSLGQALSYCLNLFNPSTITLGGGVIEAMFEVEQAIDKNPFIEGINSSLEIHSHKRVYNESIIKKAMHGNDAGLIGAALHLVSDKH